jgi:hypothetical protein
MKNMKRHAVIAAWMFALVITYHVRASQPPDTDSLAGLEDYL